MTTRKRRAGRGKLILIVFAILLALLILRYALAVRRVEIVGDCSAIGEDAVVRAANINYGQLLLSVDADAIVESVNATGVICCEGVDKRFPDKLRLHVRERGRSAMILYLGDILVLDEAMYVVETVKQVPDMDLVYLTGLEIAGYRIGRQPMAQSARIEACSEALRAIAAQGAAVYVSELNVSNPEQMQLVTRGGITVRLGNADSMDAKIAWFKSAAADLEGRGESGGTLDVSSGNKADYSK